MPDNSEIRSGFSTTRIRIVAPPPSRTYTARLALDPQTRRQAYRLRYESYLASNHIEPNASGLFEDRYDSLPNSRTVVLYDDDIPMASVRTCLISSGSTQRSPALDTFPDEIKTLLSQQPGAGYGARGIETTRLVRSPVAENNQSLVFLLYRLAGYIGMMAHTQMLFACVRRNHAPFYTRLGYSSVTQPRPYPGLSCPMQLMACTRKRYDEVRSAFPLIDPFAGNTRGLDGFLAGEPASLSLVRT